MTPIILHAFANIGMALLILGLSIPLILRKISMNHFYGIRFSQSFKSDEAWYEINSYGGKALLIASIPIFLVGLYGFLQPTNYFLISLGVVIVSLLVACLMSYSKARRF